MRQADAGKAILNSRVVVIIRAGGGVDLPAVGRALAAGGVRTLEITLNTPGALAAIALLRREFAGGELLVGAGTILCAEDVHAAKEAGAQFIVTPTLQPDSIEACRAYAMPICCGCSSPTEMLAAHRLGAGFVKLFPATRYGPAYVRAVTEVLPMLRVVPTGGVNAENVGDWFAAGAAAVAVGSQLVEAKLLATGDYAAITQRARDFLKAVPA